MCRLTEIGLPARRALLPILALALALGACGGEEPPSAPNPPPGPNPTPNPIPQTGLIQVSTATTGADFDPDGYTTAMDGHSGRSIGLNGSTVSSLSPMSPRAPTRSRSAVWPPTAR